MEIPGLPEMKKELQTRGKPELLEICNSIARLKKENKEFLAYLLYDSDDPMGYADKFREAMDEQFEMLEGSEYRMAKSLRKISNLIVKYAKFTKYKQGEAELIIHFLNHYRKAVNAKTKSAWLQGIAFQKLKALLEIIYSLPDDLQYDYSRMYNEQVEDIITRFYKWDNRKFPLKEI